MRQHIVLVPADTVSVIGEQNIFIPMQDASLADIGSAIRNAGIPARVDGQVSVAGEPPAWWITVAARQPYIIVDRIFA